MWPLVGPVLKSQELGAASVAGAVVLHEAMRALDVDELEVSPWALREGVLLRYIESLQWSAATA